MQWKGEVFFRLVGYARNAYKIGINAASIPVCGSLARESSDCNPGFFAFWGHFLEPLRIAIRCHGWDRSTVETRSSVPTSFVRFLSTKA